VTFSPDNTLIASAGWDNHTKLWSARYALLMAPSVTVSLGKWIG